MASLAAIKNAELKESELERDAVKFLSLQRREDILTLRSVLVDFHSVTLEKDSWTEEDMLKLRRLYGEIRLRIMPNSPQNEDLLLSVAEIYDKVMKIDVDGVRNTAAQFVLLSQKKLNNELRLIEKQIQNGKIE